MDLIVCPDQQWATTTNPQLIELCNVRLLENVFGECDHEGEQNGPRQFSEHIVYDSTKDYIIKPC